MNQFGAACYSWGSSSWDPPSGLPALSFRRIGRSSPLVSFVIILPWGTALLLVAIVAVTRLATLATGTRWAAWLFFTGWLAATVFLAADSPSGDLAISSGARQVVYLFGGIVLGASAATLPVDFLARKGTHRLPRPSVLSE